MSTNKLTTDLIRELAGALGDLLRIVEWKQDDQTGRGIVRVPLSRNEERAMRRERAILDRCYAALQRVRIEGPL